MTSVADPLVIDSRTLHTDGWTVMCTDGQTQIGRAHV